MTPPAAATAAGRRSTGLRSGRSSRVGSARRPPRRVSGPARPPATRPTSRPASRPVAAALGGRVAAAAAAAVALPQHAPRPSAPPRRRPSAVPRPARRPDLPLGARALEWLRALPDHRLLERLISGRIWIVLLGTLLVGIVTLQLTLLRMNAGIGRAIEQSTALQQQNAALKLDLSQLANAERVVGQATQMGYVWPLQGSPRYLTASPADADTALSTMRVPNPTPAPPPASVVLTSVVSTPASTTPATTAATATTPSATVPAAAAPSAAATTTAGTATGAAPTTSAAAVGGGASAPVGPQG